MDDISKFESYYYQLLELDDDEKKTSLERLARTDPQFFKEFIILYKNEDHALSYFDKMEERITSVMDENNHPIGDVVGSYRLTELLGSGGMANVYKAERKDGLFDRKSALKVIKRGIDTDEVISRFSHERSILASLKHENITQLYDGGVTEKGLPYFVMEYIDGENIITYSDLNRLSVRKRLKLFLQVCNALDFAHKNLIIHRDIKPGNIFVENNGTVKLMDFGIARILRNEAKHLTRADSRILTPEYASPEQLRGGYVNTTSDIYQAGILLYEMLSNKQAFDKSSGKHRLDFKGKEISSELVSIIQTATREDPGERYNSAEALKNDIISYLQNRPIHARGNNFTYRTRKFLSRNRMPITITAAVLLVIGFLTGKYIIDITEARRAEAYRSIHANSTMNFLLSTFANQLPRNASGDTLTVFDLMDRMEYQLKNDKTFFKENLSRVYNLLADINYRYKNYEKSYEQYHNALAFHVEDPYDQHFSDRHKYISLLGLARNFYVVQQKDSSAYYYHRAISMARENGINPLEAYTGLGKLKLLGNDYVATDSLFREGLKYTKRADVPSQESVAFFLGVYGNFLARYFPYENEKKIDSLFKASIRIYNQPIAYLSNMDFEINDKFKEFYQERGRITGPVLKLQHPTSYAEVVNYYGLYFYRMEKYDSAAYYFQEAFQVNSNYYGASSIVALENASNLGVIYREMGKIEQAKEMFLECWEKSQDNPDIQPAFALSFYHNYATILYAEKKYNESLHALDTVLMLRKKYAPKNDFGLNHAYRFIGQNLHKLGRSDEALEYLNLVIERHLDHAGDNGFQDLLARIQMIKIYGDLQEASQVEDLYLKNQAGITDRFGSGSHYLHKNMAAKAEALLKMDRASEAAYFIKPALNDSITSHEKNYLRFLYAKSLYKTGEHQKASTMISDLQNETSLKPQVKQALTEFTEKIKQEKI